MTQNVLKRLREPVVTTHKEKVVIIRCPAMVIIAGYAKWGQKISCLDIPFVRNSGDIPRDWNSLIHL